MKNPRPPDGQTPMPAPRHQGLPSHVQGPVAVGGHVSQRGEYVAGHTLTIDQSIHTGGLLMSWLSRPQPAPTAIELGRARHDLLDQVDRNWVQEVQRSLDKVARIDLGFVERPDAVDSPVRAILRRPPEPDRPLQPGVSVGTVYRAFGRQVLILGEPGAGKTTLLLELARELLEEARADQGEPMPVVFHLSTWTIEQRPLDVWLADELNRRYGVSRRLARIWLSGDQIVPLLDGLDEVAPGDRDACVAAINVFHDAHGQLPLVICSRLHEYEALQARLQLRAAVVVQPLKRPDVDQYLRMAGPPMARVRSALREDDQLWDLLTTPLVLSLVCLTYQGRPATLGREQETLEERRRRVFADYVEAMISRPRPSARPETHPIEDTMRWLKWLARTMGIWAQSVFYLDWIQPDWLPTRFQRWLATTGLAAGVGLTSGLLFGVLSGLVFSWVGGSVAGLPAGPLAGTIFGVGVALAHGLAAYARDVSPPEGLFWSWATLRRNLPGCCRESSRDCLAARSWAWP